RYLFCVPLRVCLAVDVIAQAPELDAPCMSDECKTRAPDRLVSSSVALVMTVDSLERHFSEAMRQRVCSPGPTDPGEHRRIFMHGDRDDRRLRLLVDATVEAD